MESPAAGTEAPSAPETVTITTLNADKESVELEVPYDPQRIAILDMASLDILDALGVAEGRVVGTADTSLDYLQSYVTDENMANLGTIKEADLEAVMACEPDVIFIGGRLAASPTTPSARSPLWSIWPPIASWAWWRACARTPLPSPPCLAWRTRWTS